ncbi:inactive ubiquitin carboxyl-terminal hydrolase MINDY-4B [Biomphalaria pfeifferi]|uniref:Ubiquitin carboxyl-terminal hydrolase MINDY n=1 Tax=Biomphalaria pfeifferi TaxID=112525 RepID=A0AAD8F354_BIOPF|nr:inactive ubiquitin carboxyl-terminal hydrolase MINDY-4B [Biomphalaria pfeifferi]
MDNASDPLLTERDKLTRLLSFLDIETKIGPGNEPKRQSSFPIQGRRSLAASFDSSIVDHPIPTLSPPFVTQRLQTFYVDSWPAVTVKQGDTIIFPNTPRKSSSNTLGGIPITLDTAVELRSIVYGSPMHSFSKDWQKATLKFYLLDSPFPFGIETSKCGARGLALCVQGFMLKHLIFDREYKSSVLQEAGVLKPTAFERRRALAGAVCEMLWQAGDRRKCCVCLKQQEPCFGPDYRYRPDSITEKLHLFEFKKFEDLHNFIKRHLEEFQTEHGNGCILFLYSLVLSRTIPKIREEIKVKPGFKLKLLSDMEDPTQSLINLALTGSATPHLHNGELLYDDKGNLLPHPVHGIQTRSQIGFMFWDKGEDPEKRTEVGSMLKTPKNPIWVSKVNGQFGLLFSLNPDLVSDWRVENKFTMWYYTGVLSQVKPTVLFIETRVGRPRPKTGLQRREEENKIPPLENCIMTKWYGADVKWNGTVPFV